MIFDNFYIVNQISYILEVDNKGRLIKFPILQDSDGTLFEIKNDSVVIVDDVNGEEINLIVS